MSAAVALSAAALAAAHRQFEAALPAMTETIRYNFRRLAPAAARRRHRRRPGRLLAGLARPAGPGQGPRGRRRHRHRLQRLAGTSRTSASSAAGPRAGAAGTSSTPRPRRPAASRSSASTGISGRSRARSPTPGASGWPRTTGSARPTRPAFRVDFEDWLASLPARDRRVAELLATGEMTQEVARMVGISPGRVSQLRRELAESWQEFQGEPGRAALAHA